MEPKQSNPDSLRHFFGSEKADAFKEALVTFMKSDEYSELREEVTNQLRTIPWPSAVTKIAEEAQVLLDTPVSHALKEVYARAKVFDRYLDPDAYDPEEVVLVELAEHTVTSHHEPQLDIVISGKSIGALKFVIDLSLKLKGGILKIQDARIKEINPGTSQGSGTITFYGKVLIAKESEEITLLGPFDLGDGIPIAP